MRVRGLRQLLRNDEGITALEFAMIVPVFCLLMFGTMEFSLIWYASNTLESATSNSARLGKTGYVGEGTTREDQIRNMVADRSHGLMDPNDLNITYVAYQEFDQIGQPEPFQDTNDNGFWDEGEPYDDINANGNWDEDMGVAGLGNANDIVVYTVTYPWPLSTPIISHIIGGESGIFNLQSRVIVKNEPYDLEAL